MIDKLADIAPKAVIVTAIAWGALSYTVTGPEAATRILRADHMPKCQTGFSTDITRRAEEAAAAVPKPAIDPQREAAAGQLRELLSSQMSRAMENHPIAGASVRQMRATLDAFEAEKRAARQTYDETVRRVREATRSNLGKGGDYCGCLSDAAIDEARTEFAVMAGTFGLVRPIKVRDLGGLLAQQEAKGKCTTLKAAG